MGKHEKRPKTSETPTGNGFIHTSKRTPQFYKTAARLLKEVEQKKDSLKNIYYKKSKDLRDPNKTYSLLIGICKNLLKLKWVMERSDLLKINPRLDKYLGLIFLYEILILKREHPKPCGAYEAIYKHKDLLDQVMKDLEDNPSLVKLKEEIRIPRYARVNLLLTTMDEVLETLEAYEYVLKESPQTTTMKDFFFSYKELCNSLQDYEFVIDPQIDGMLVFAHGVNLNVLDLVRDRKLLLQDKSSCLASLALNPPPESRVLDACAAPGMKTIHLAELMENRGLMFATDCSAPRAATLEKLLNSSGVKMCRSQHRDFLKVDPQVEPYSSVEYILIDAPCTGSGMVSRFDYEDGENEMENEHRISKLANIQAMLLRHAFKFPNVKRIVYSTCSVNDEENEMVVKEMLQLQNKFDLERCLPDWPVRGKEEYDFGSLCVRASAKHSLTNGFFVALFQRLAV